jgi:catechol 2,3-dioxygenase-like lactoylglutathione lyase family enzyme
MIPMRHVNESPSLAALGLRMTQRERSPGMTRARLSPKMASGISLEAKEISMQFHRGRLVDHIHLRVSDLEASRRFYRAVLEAIGTSFTSESPKHFSCDELWVDQADGSVSRVHLAFQASDAATVHAFHAAALANGGRDNGAPGERPYHPGYYGAFALDPDGNNVEAVFHGPAERSAASVVLKPQA